MLVAFVDTATVCLKLWDGIIIIAHIKKLVLPWLRKKFNAALERERERELNELENNTNNRKVMTSLKCTKVIGGKCKRQIILLNSIWANVSPTKCLSEKKDLENIKSGILFGYVKCDFEVPENLVEAFANFSPFFWRSLMLIERTLVRL